QLHPWLPNDSCLHCCSRKYRPGHFFADRATIRPSHLERHTVSNCNNGHGCLHHLFLHILRRQSEHYFLSPIVCLRSGWRLTLLCLGVICKLFSPSTIVRDTKDFL